MRLQYLGPDTGGQAAGAGFGVGRGVCEGGGASGQVSPTTRKLCEKNRHEESGALRQTAVGTGVCLVSWGGCERKPKGN